MARGHKTGRTDDERLRHFVSIVDRCVGSTAIQSGTIEARWLLSSSPEQGAQVQAHLGDADHVRSLMIDFRKLWSDTDDAHFLSICNITERRLVDADLIDAVRTNRGSWKRVLSGTTSGHFTFDRDGRSVAGDDVLKVWINGVLFHNNPVDQQFYENLDHETQLLFQQQANAMVMTLIQIAYVQRNAVLESLTR